MRGRKGVAAGFKAHNLSFFQQTGEASYRLAVEVGGMRENLAQLVFVHRATRHIEQVENVLAKLRQLFLPLTGLRYCQCLPAKCRRRVR